MTAGPAEAWRTFRDLGATRHLAGVLLVALLLAGRFALPIFAAGPIEDEEVYVAAFELAQHGQSPYGIRQFYYLPPFAAAGGWALDHLGLGPTLGLLRGANLLAMALLLWLASAFWPLSFRARVLAAAIFGALAPAVDLALAWGNLSPLAIAGWTLTFLLWPRRPLVAGLTFTLAMLIKPLAAIAILVLALHRPLAGKPGFLVSSRAALLAAAVAAVLLPAALLATPWLRDFLELGAGIPTAARSASLQRLLYCFGFEVSALLLMLAVAALATFLVRRRPRGEAELYGFAAVAGLLATPLVWSHTLLLTLPLQSAALALAWQRHRAGRRLIELLLVTTAVLAIELSNGLGGIETWPLPLQGLFVLLPCLAPLGLLLYLSRLLGAEGPFRGGTPGPDPLAPP